MADISELQRVRTEEHPYAQRKQAHLDKEEGEVDIPCSGERTEEECDAKEEHKFGGADNRLLAAHCKHEENTGKIHFLDDCRFALESGNAPGSDSAEVLPDNETQKQVERVVWHLLSHKRPENVKDNQEPDNHRHKRPQVPQERPAIFHHKIRPSDRPDDENHLPPGITLHRHSCMLAYFPSVNIIYRRRSRQRNRHSPRRSYTSISSPRSGREMPRSPRTCCRRSANGFICS